MHLYRLCDGWQGLPEDEKTFWAGTRSDAHDEAKDQLKRGLRDRDRFRIELVDVPTDKEGVLAMLNGKDLNTELLQTWSLTSRGGLQEVPNGE